MLVEFPERPRAGSDTGSAPLAEASASRVSDPGLVVAVIPAHDEQARIGKAIRSLDEQSSPPDLTIVCADNCTDRTAIAAEAAGADVIVTEGNEHGRAGAVNQALELLLPCLRDDDAVLVMDPSSFLAPRFISEARRLLQEGAGGVGGIFTGLESSSIVRLLHGTEYERFARVYSMLGANQLVASGKATLFSTQALSHVLIARAAGLLPGGERDDVYDVRAESPDVELSLALLHLGYKVIASR